MKTSLNPQLTGFYYHPYTGFIAKRVGKTKFGYTYKLVNVRTPLGDTSLSELNKWTHDADVTPAENVLFLRDLGITAQEINEELIYHYSTDYSDRKL